jgi:hypothetical protein
MEREEAVGRVGEVEMVRGGLFMVGARAVSILRKQINHSAKKLEIFN